MTSAMRRLATCVLAGAATGLGVAAARQDDRDEARIERGRYLVHHVAMCIECHTPRSEGGKLDTTRLLAGAPIPVESPYPKMPWAFQAPRLAGLPSGWSEQQLVEFLQTGKPATTEPPRSPMPPFRMSEADARAVAAYLRAVGR